MTIEVPSKEELQRLREDERKTREEIAEMYGVSLSTVKRWIRTLGVRKKKKKSLIKKIGRRGEIVIPVKEDKTVIEQAKDILGTRMGYSRIKGYTLDGFPASIDKLVRAAGLKYRDE